MEINSLIKDKILSKKIFRGRIITGSMEPVIKIGDEITVEIKARDLKRFDIIVFESNNKLFCHYIWILNQLVEPKLLQTRSINGSKDFPIDEENYIGKVLSHKLSLWQKIKILLFN